MDPETLRDALREHPDTKLVVAIHAETSTGVLQDIEPLAGMAHAAGALFMTDCVTSLAGSPVEFDKWDIDFAYSGSQKCLAAPPGISPVAMSERAYEHIKNRRQPPTSWYLDLKLIADYWSSKHAAHHTSPVSMVYGLREALALTLNEGLEQRWTRHSRNAAALRAGLEALGLDMPVREEDRLDQLTVIRLPAGVGDVKLRNQLLDEYNIEIGRGLGQFAGKVIRIGLMGESCVPANVLALLNALETILPQHGFEIAQGEGVAAASRMLAEQPAPAH
jgi:alanine-glyoxylate transaminase/serine-glyoxylate transaminase/serine-pyruvate transaminase